MGDLHREEVAFFGRITAAFTHELKNVLAIVKENAGLMEDFLGLPAFGAVPHKERLLRAIQSIRDQTDRGVDLSNRLNRFAHTTDNDRLKVDLCDLTRHLAVLVERFARLREVKLTVPASSAPVPVETNPVRCQLVLLTGLECCWNTDQVSEVELKAAERESGEAVLLFSAVGKAGSPKELMERVTVSADWERLAMLAEDLGGRVEASLPEALFAVVLPRS